jgi:hypothetical protein
MTTTIHKMLFAVLLIFLLFGDGRCIVEEEMRGKKHKKRPNKSAPKRQHAVRPLAAPLLDQQTERGAQQQMVAHDAIKLDASKYKNPVVVFTAWHKFDNITKYKPRIDHHIAYTKLHGYKYVIFVAIDISADDRILLGKDVDVILVPGFAERTDTRSQKPLQTGWLKIEGFKILHSDISAPALFFYLDMDVVFYNFNVSLTSVFEGKTQSIFVQEQQAGRMFSPSHAVAIRNTPAALRFIDDWASLLPQCPHLNMEQGGLACCPDIFYEPK